MLLKLRRAAYLLVPYMNFLRLFRVPTEGIGLILKTIGMFLGFSKDAASGIIELFLKV